MTDRQTAEQIALAVRRIAEVLFPVLRQFTEVVTELWDAVRCAFRTAYEALGCPYGLSDENMWRYWTDKQAELAQLSTSEAEAKCQAMVEDLVQALCRRPRIIQ